MAKRKRNESTEFWCFWFESIQEWCVCLADGEQLRGFTAIGYAVNAALERCCRGEAEFECTLDSGVVYHYEKDDEYWRTT